MQVSLFVFTGADLQRVFQNVERNVVAVIVVVILVAAGRLSGFEYNPEITLTSRFDLARAGPPVERRWVVRPGSAPVELVAAPEKIAQRFVSFGPDQIAFVVFIVSSDQFFQLLLGLFKFSGVGRLS